MGLDFRVVKVTETKDDYSIVGDCESESGDMGAVLAGHIFCSELWSRDKEYTYWLAKAPMVDGAGRRGSLTLRHYNGPKRAPYANEVIRRLEKGMDKKTPVEERAEQMSSIADYVQAQKEFPFFAYVVIKSPGGGVLHVNRSLPKKLGREIFSKLVALELAGPEFGNKLDLDELDIVDEGESDDDEPAEDI